MRTQPRTGGSLMAIGPAARVRAKASAPELAVAGLLAQSRAYSPAHLAVCEELLADERFCEIPSSLDKHHCFDGGNVVHTREVVALALAHATTATAAGARLDVDVVFLSALLHDYGKVWTYRKTAENWVKVQGYTKQLHIEHSLEFARAAMNRHFPHRVTLHVLHCIGAHHGRLDYGALWEPRTPEAWLVHLADMASVFAVQQRRPGA